MMINKRFQISLIAKFLLVNVLVLALFGLGLYMFLDSEIETNLLKAHVTYQNMKEMMLPIIITLSILNILISSAIITLFVLFASFRIAGPLYRFNTAVNEICTGNLKPLLKLREGDELYALSESLQQMAGYLVQTVDKAKSIVSDLKSINQRLNDDELEKKIAELQAILAELRYE